MKNLILIALLCVVSFTAHAENPASSFRYFMKPPQFSTQVLPYYKRFGYYYNETVKTMDGTIPSQVSTRIIFYTGMVLPKNTHLTYNIYVEPEFLTVYTDNERYEHGPIYGNLTTDATSYYSLEFDLGYIPIDYRGTSGSFRVDIWNDRNLVVSHSQNFVID